TSASLSAATRPRSASRAPAAVVAAAGLSRLLRPRTRSRSHRAAVSDRAARTSSAQLLAAAERLDAVVRRLRVECPWEREQDERSIVPHTVEEAYELADAAHHGDDAKLLDELGDVLFQVWFLALLLEERGAGSLAQVAETLREKLIRRHPHV